MKLHEVLRIHRETGQKFKLPGHPDWLKINNGGLIDTCAKTSYGNNNDFFHLYANLIDEAEDWEVEPLPEISDNKRQDEEIKVGDRVVVSGYPEYTAIVDKIHHSFNDYGGERSRLYYIIPDRGFGTGGMFTRDQIRKMDTEKTQDEEKIFLNIPGREEYLDKYDLGFLDYIGDQVEHAHLSKDPKYPDPHLLLADIYQLSKIIKRKLFEEKA